MTVAQSIPSVDAFLALEPEELGAKLLFLIRGRFGENMFYPDDFETEIWEADIRREPTYPQQHRAAVMLALSEAWAWLGAQGLIVPAAQENGRNGYRVLSRRARRFASEAEFANYRVARTLQREALNSRIADKVWLAFMRGEFDAAVFQAMKAVEIAVREAIGLPDNVLGTKLMQAAFAPDNGPLTDMGAESGERQGRMQLFVGSIASYKNPHSHRDVDLNDPAEAVEIILLANHLLRIVDARGKAKT